MDILSGEVDQITRGKAENPVKALKVNKQEARELPVPEKRRMWTAKARQKRATKKLAKQLMARWESGG